MGKEEKVKKQSDAEAKETIVAYMKRMNRPFNSKMVTENLHGVVGATQAKKLMADLCDEGKLEKKEFGKAILYWIAQDAFPAVDDAQLAQMDTDIKQLEQSLRLAKEQAKSAASAVAKASSSLSTDQLKERVAALEASTGAASKKLAKADGAEVVDRSAFERQDAALQKAMKEWAKRRKIAMSILGDLSEGMDKSMKELKALIDFEDDKQASVDLAAMQAKYKPAPVKRVGPMAGGIKKRRK